MEVININTIVTSKEAILSVCLGIASESGLQALNMRAVAKKCNVSVGSVYNYFPSKADLIAATVQNVWQGIFHDDKGLEQIESFSEYVKQFFEKVQTGAAEYPNFFNSHSISFASSDKGRGREVMEEYFGHMKAGLLGVLLKDNNVKDRTFDSAFTEKVFVDFVFSNLITLLLRQEESCFTLIEIIDRILY